MIKKKPVCKKGIGKAIGFPGCDKEVFKKTFGLCDSCLYDFYTNDERGKIIYKQKRESLNKSNWKEQKKVLKENIKTLSQLENDAKKSFQRWIRLRDTELNCVSCNTSKAKEWHASHYFDCNRFSGLIFDTRNVHKSCDYCNIYLRGNLIEYRQGLIKRFNVEFVEKLESEADSKRVYKYTKQELIDIKKKYDLKIKNNDFN